MSIAKVQLNTNEIKWEVRYYPDGRKSRRIRKRFDKKIETEAYLEKIKIDFG